SWSAVLGAPDARLLTPVLVGPTAVGKTAVAVALATLTPLSVISADARQVYRGLDIGTAKPERDVRARVPHAGLDLVDPGERCRAKPCAPALRRGSMRCSRREWSTKCGACWRAAWRPTLPVSTASATAKS